jgi:GTP cyclohydrolase I
MITSKVWDRGSALLDMLAKSNEWPISRKLTGLLTQQAEAISMMLVILSRRSHEEKNRMNFMSNPLKFESDNGKILVPDEIQESIRSLIRWAGDDPDREGLTDTPKRVARAWREYCQGYDSDPGQHLSRTFEEVGGYDEIVILKNIPFQSHCEHHMAPITGMASIAYLPTDRVVGISKLARVLHGYAQRLQVQERLTAQVAQAIWDHLKPQGVAVIIEAQHGCMTGRGVKTHGVGMVTSRMLGCFLDNAESRKEVLALMQKC